MSNRYYQGPRTDHFDGQRFFHPGIPSTDKSFRQLLRWRMEGKWAPWPTTVAAGLSVQPAEAVEGLRVTLIGHASLLVQAAGTNILVDPVWAERASPFRFAGPRRCNPPAIALDRLPKIDAVLLTHNHYDHMDVRTVAALWKEHRPLIVAPLGNDTILCRAARDMKVTVGDWWDAFPLSATVRATLVPAYHWSARSVGDRREALWGGFVLETPRGCIYCAGDTAYQDGKIFAQIGERFGPPLVAVVPIGAYAPRWFMASQHVDPEEAVRIAEACGAPEMLGVHWGTFPLTGEPYEEPAERLAEAARRQGSRGLQTRAMRPGDVWEPAG